MYSNEKATPMRDLVSGLFLFAMLAWSSVPFFASMNSSAVVSNRIVSVRVVTLEPMLVVGHRSDAASFLSEADLSAKFR